MFPIRRVDREVAEAMETLGTKPKFWFREGNRRLLFKAEERGTGEDWAEVIACHLCRLLGIPHVEYELAQEFENGKPGNPGVVCENMAPSTTLILGNQLLLERDSDYPLKERFHVRQHSVGAVAAVLVDLQPPAPLWMTAAPPEVASALDVFVGYVLLDAWIANQDRHHENWAAIRDDAMRLAPTFDHGAGLARNLTDEERQERLTTRDRGRTVLAFAERGRSAFYNEAKDTRALSLVDAFQQFAALAPVGAAAWKERLAAVAEESVQAIINEIAPERMSEVARRFTLELLRANRDRILQGKTP